MKFIRIKLIVVYISLMSLSLVSCKKFIEVTSPITSLTDGNVYKNDKTAAAVLTDIYATMSNDNTVTFLGSKLSSLSLQAGLSADEITLYNLNNLNLAYYYKNDLRSNQGVHFWDQIYPVIFICNAAINGLNQSISLTPTVKQQLLGEAKFMRAFFYFYLVNLYGDVPLVLTTDYKVNALLPRTEKEKVYEQIIVDLKDAQSLLNVDYVDASLINLTTERVRPNKAVATALLARTYLYINDWANAEIQATALISNSIVYDMVDLNEVFIKNSKETIWALQPVGSTSSFNANTGEGKLFVLTATGPDQFNHEVYLSKRVIDAFESADMRKVDWTSKVTVDANEYNYAYKYKVGRTKDPTTEYPIILRLAEQYLIRAEARAQKGDINGSQSDLNVIRKRAGLGNTSASSTTLLIDAILHERQVELFTEWGHRWLDLKRTGKIDSVMQDVSSLKAGAIWSDNKSLFPIPQTEISKNPSLRGHQNPGYSE